MKPRRVVTVGTFDLLHDGHINILRHCAFLGDVTVGLNTDEFVESYKGQPPVMPFETRRTVLLALKSVTSVIPCDGDGAACVARAVPDYVVVGSDWARKDYYRQMGFDQDWLDDRGITLCYVPYTKSISTTGIRARGNL